MRKYSFAIIYSWKRKRRGKREEEDHRKRKTIGRP
tara:strand:+ start:213 stop:317 length:105 start_codon:yes stop_codon:yes gene_type:complete